MLVAGAMQIKHTLNTEIEFFSGQKLLTVVAIASVVDVGQSHCH